MHWLIAFLRVLFPSPQMARWMARVLNWMDGVEALLSDLENLPDLQTREGRLKLEAGIALVEDWINFLTNARAAELLGRRYTYIQRDGRIWEPSAPRDWASLMQRYRRLWSSFARIERMAHRRANQMRREADANPLGLANPMMMIRDHHDDRAAIIITRKVLHRLARGRGHARGPPFRAHADFRNVASAALASGVAPACLILTT